MNAQDIDWDDLKLALAICHAGSLSGAARTLGVNHSTVFRRLTAMEKQLGVRLFERQSNGYAMTEAGEAVLQVGERIEHEMQGLSRQLIGRDLQLNGKLRVTGPDALSVMILVPLIADFSRLYPGIQVELSLANRSLDLSSREADIAIRATCTPPDSTIGHRLCALQTTAYASSTYLASNPSKNLSEHRWLMPDATLDLWPANKWLKKHHPDAIIGFRSNAFLALFAMVKQGLGSALLPCFLADPEPDLKRIMPIDPALTSEVWLLIHPDLIRTARVRAFVDFMREAIQKDVMRLEGSTGGLSEVSTKTGG